MKRQAIPMFASLLVMTWGLSHAEEWAVDGSIENAVTSAQQAVDEDTLVVHVGNTGTVKMADTSNPMHGATGTCSGSVLVDKGSPAGEGLCTYEDADGERIVFRWTSESLSSAGGNAGSWTLLGGTGRWATATASGSFSDAPSEDGGSSINTISGELSMQ